MNWEAYVKWTDSTAIYPEAGTASPMEMAYIALGLLGELGELADHQPSSPEFAAELGDVLWYLARGWRVLGVELDGLRNQDGDYDGPFKIANLSKKLIRDGDQEYLKEKLREAYLDTYLAMVGEIESAGFDDLRSVLQANVDKLESRKERGVLKGSGDHR
jgi:hypothetical protein